jgi:hypothetical protein
MQTNKKKCKGTGKAKGHGCGNIEYIFRYGLCKKCFSEWLYNTPEGLELIKKTTIRAKAKTQEEQKKERRIKKHQSKSIAGLIQEARKPFQKLIRIRDHKKQCICCDRILPFNIGEYDAGHLFPANIYTGIIFHPDNVHGQTVYCNQHLYGNESGYTSGLINRIGKERYKRLESAAKRLKGYKWERFTLIELKKHYIAELRDVEKGIKDISDVDFSVGII